MSSGYPHGREDIQKSQCARHLVVSHQPGGVHWYDERSTVIGRVVSCKSVSTSHMVVSYVNTSHMVVSCVSTLHNCVSISHMVMSFEFIITHYPPVYTGLFHTITCHSQLNTSLHFPMATTFEHSVSCTYVSLRSWKAS